MPDAACWCWAPGESLRTRKAQVLEFIRREQPLVLAVNFADPAFQVEVCFVSSHKRLDIAGGRLRDLPGVRRVFTSNLAAMRRRTVSRWTPTGISTRTPWWRTTPG